MVNWFQHYGKRILSVICSLDNFLFRGNLATCFFFGGLMINGNAHLIKIFLLHILHVITF